jgi:hypothetical protein
MNSNYYTSLYYKEVLGEYPSDEKFMHTDKLFEYLMDAGISHEDIVKNILTLSQKECLTVSDLPDALWDGSLLKRGTYYFHNALRVKQAMPTWNPETNKMTSQKSSVEMKIRFTMDDLIEYFYRNTQANRDLSDRKKDAGAFRYLLAKYGNVDFADSMDMVMSLIDHAKGNEHNELLNILKLQNYESEVYDIIKPMCKEAKGNGRMEIKWRTGLLSVADPGTDTLRATSL